MSSGFLTVIITASRRLVNTSRTTVFHCEPSTFDNHTETGVPVTQHSGTAVGYVVVVSTTGDSGGVWHSGSPLLFAVAVDCHRVSNCRRCRKFLLGKSVCLPITPVIWILPSPKNPVWKYDVFLSPPLIFISTVGHHHKVSWLVKCCPRNNNYQWWYRQVVKTHTTLR